MLPTSKSRESPFPVADAVSARSKSVLMASTGTRLFLTTHQTRDLSGVGSGAGCRSASISQGKTCHSLGKTARSLLNAERSMRATAVSPRTSARFGTCGGIATSVFHFPVRVVFRITVYSITAFEPNVCLFRRGYLINSYDKVSVKDMAWVERTGFGRSTARSHQPDKFGTC